MDQSSTLNNKKLKKVLYYQETEIFKNVLYFLKIEIIVHFIEKANIFLYSLKTKVLRNCVKNLVFYNLSKQKFERLFFKKISLTTKILAHSVIVVLFSYFPKQNFFQKAFYIHQEKFLHFCPNKRKSIQNE